MLEETVHSISAGITDGIHHPLVQLRVFDGPQHCVLDQQKYLLHRRLRAAVQWGHPAAGGGGPHLQQRTGVTDSARTPQYVFSSLEGSRYKLQRFLCVGWRVQH